jgi:hypothetical protein
MFKNNKHDKSQDYYGLQCNITLNENENSQCNYDLQYLA